MCQSQTEIEHSSFTHSTKGGAQTCFTDISDIHAFTKHIWALTLAEAQCYIWHVELGYVLGMCRQQNDIWFLSETDTHVNGMYVPWQSHPLGLGVVLVSHHEESTVCGDWYTCPTYATQTTHPDTQWESDTADKLTFLCLGTAKDWGWKLAISSHMWLIYMYVHRLPYSELKKETDLQVLFNFSSDWNYSMNYSTVHQNIAPLLHLSVYNFVPQLLLSVSLLAAWGMRGWEWD